MDLSSSTDIQLSLQIIQAQSGCDTAFNALYKRYLPTTIAYLKQVFNSENNEDIAQQVWLKIYQQIKTLQNPYGFKAWLLQITRRTAFSYFEKEKRINQLSDFIDEVVEDEQDNLPNPLDIADLESIHSALDQLSSPQREAVILFYWQELSCYEIAQITGSSIGTVKSRLFHARNILQVNKQIKQLQKEVSNG